MKVEHQASALIKLMKKYKFIGHWIGLCLVGWMGFSIATNKLKFWEWHDAERQGFCFLVLVCFITARAAQYFENIKF